MQVLGDQEEELTQLADADYLPRPAIALAPPNATPFAHPRSEASPSPQPPPPPLPLSTAIPSPPPPNVTHEELQTE